MTPLLGLVIRSIPIGNGRAMWEGKLQGEKSTDEAQLYQRRRGSHWEGGKEEGSQQDTGTGRPGHEQKSPHLPCYPTHWTPAGCCPVVAMPSGYTGIANTLLFSWAAHREPQLSVLEASNHSYNLYIHNCILGLKINTLGT